MPTPKPHKPRPTFPLFKHQVGQWAKKIRQKLVYFGKVAGDEDGQQALARWLREKDYLLAGQKPPPAGSSRLLVRGLVNAYLTSRQKLVDQGDRPEAYFLGMKATADRMVRVFGLVASVELLRPDDFARLGTDMAKTMGPATRRREITKTRQFFRWAYER